MIIFVINELSAFKRHRENLAAAAIAKHFKVAVYAAPVGDTHGLKYEFRPLAIERFRLKLFSDAKLFLTVLYSLMNDRPKVLHLINIKPYLFGGLAARLARLFGWRGRLVVTVPGLGRLYDTQLGLHWKAWIRRGVVECALRFGMRWAQVTFETAHDRDVWIKKGLVRPNQTVVFAGAGVDMETFRPRLTSSAGNSIKVLFAGRLLGKKGLETYLAAAAQIGDSEVEMLVAGFVEEDPDSISADRLQGERSITFLGPVDNMPELLRQTDIVVLPSCYNEGIPRILIEAAAVGCVLIATRFPGSEKLIIEKETGFFLDHGDVGVQSQQLAAMICELKKRPDIRSAVGARAAEYVRANNYSVEDVTGSFLSLYGCDEKGLGDGSTNLGSRGTKLA